jgi:hypothetical protein
MSVRLAALVLIASIPASLAVAQQSPPAPAPARTLDERIAALEKRADAADLKIDGVKSDLDKLANLVKDQTGNIDKLQALILEQNTKIERLRTDASEVTTRVNGELSKHERILTEVARQDGDRYVPQLSAAMAKESFRQELGAAVHASLRTRGQFRIVNKTATPQSIALNLVDQVLQPGEERTFDVPVGTVTTQLPGEPLVNWTLAHKGEGVYAESIDIVPKTTVQRVVVDSPVYYRPIYSETLPIVTYRPY